LDLPPKDYDVATNATPSEVLGLFDRVVQVGVSFGVVRVLISIEGELQEIEVATFRNDGPYMDGRHPEAVQFTNVIEDVQRRDFTLNGLVLTPSKDGRSGEIIDYVGGLDDLQKRTLRAIGDAQERFDEDALRLLRAVRFAARFDLTIEPMTAAALTSRKQHLDAVSKERIQMELLAMLRPAYAAHAVELLATHGLHEALWPSLQIADPELTHTQMRMSKLCEALSEACPSDCGFPAQRDLDPALACASFFESLRSPGEPLPASIRASLRLSNAQGRALHAIAAIKDELDAFAERKVSLRPAQPELVRCLRRPYADAALCLAISAHLDGRDEQIAWLQDARRVRAEAHIEDWSPTRLVTGTSLQQLGFEPGPRFRAALWAAEALQLQGQSAQQCLQAAIDVFEAPVDHA
tara:strand:- start:5 stop:1231 length:1227 start_codon:yes stop_codon:yes gene_type:complete